MATDSTGSGNRRIQVPARREDEAARVKEASALIISFSMPRNDRDDGVLPVAGDLPDAR
jgi:hypothetical protein